MEATLMGLGALILRRHGKENSNEYDMLYREYYKDPFLYS